MDHLTRSPLWSARAGLSLALLLLAAACGSSDDNRTLRIIKGAALREGVVTGFVVDDETEKPVRAEVLVGGTPVRARADGSFEAPVSAGRVRVEVRSEGYLKTFRDVAVGGKSLPMPFKVARRAPKQVPGSKGGKFTYRDASLEVPEGAYADKVGVSLTHLSRVRVAAIAAMPQFIDEQGVPRRAVALVDLTSDEPPATAVRARVPVPTDATMDNILGYVIDGGGNWTTPITPDAVGGGFAEFVFTGDMQLGVAVDARSADGKKVGYLVTERGDTGSVQGDVLGGTEIAVGSRAAAIVDPQGSRVEMAPGTRARVEVPTDSSTASRAPYAGTVGVTAGRARVVVPAPAVDAPKLIKLTVTGNAGQFDVKGTAFTVATCGSAPNVVDVLEVVEGVVVTSAGTDKKDVGAGETATICTDCSEGAVSMCIPPESDAQAPADDDGGAPGRTDGGTGPALDAAVSDAASTGDDASTASDVPVTPAPDAMTQPGPDASTPKPDAAIKLDLAAPMPDAAAIKLDTAAPTPDSAAPTPDAAPPSPDAAPATPDVQPDASAAAFSISPGTQNFGPVTIGMNSATVNFTVTNLGDLTSGPPTVQVAGEFVIGTNGCINPVPSNTSCVIGVYFKPATAGAVSGVLTVATSAGNLSSASLMGTGVSPVPGQYALKPLSYDFGWKQMGRATGDVIFTLTNTGGMPTAIPTYAIGGQDAADFAFSTAAPRIGFCKTALQPGASCTLSLHFAPKSAGSDTNSFTKTATLTIMGNPGGTVTATLTGHAMLATGGLEIDPPFTNFGSVPPPPVGGTSISQQFSFTVRNTGTVLLTQLGFPLAVPHAVAAPREWNFDYSDCVTNKNDQLSPPGTGATPDPNSYCTVIAVYRHLAPTNVTRWTDWHVTGILATTGAQAEAATYVQAFAQ
jgi:hypothetical protein